MKRLRQWLSLIMLLGFIQSTTGCLIFEVKKLPPGQTKKIEGSQKAKDYAPGQDDKKGHK